MTDKLPILELRDVTKSYGDAETTQTHVLKGITMNVTAGDSLAIIGPSGSGKSTLLNIIGTLDRPSSGSVIINGKDISELDDATVSRLRNAQIGFVFQLHHLLPQCTALENVLVPTLIHHAGEQAAEHARKLMDRVGLSHRLNHRPGQLSGGERQRVAVVRALINSPEILLADEPTGSLHQSGADELTRLLVELNREEETTLILVTHSQRLAKQMDRALRIEDGVLAG